MPPSTAKQRLSQVLCHLSSRPVATNATNGSLVSGITQNQPLSTTAFAVKTEGKHPHHVPPETTPVNFHQLNPTYFLPRSAQIEPQALAIVHKSVNGKIIERTYKEFSDRVMGLAYYFKKHNYKRIAILGPNTPAHLETMFAAVAAGGITMGLNYRLKKSEIEYMLDLGKADLVVVDAEFKDLADAKPGKLDVIVDEDLGDPNSTACQYSSAVREGLEAENGRGWAGLDAEHVNEDALIGLYFTSGTTGRPKAVEYTNRGVYLAAMANIVEAGYNSQDIFGRNRCHYLWTLPMFHAMGWTCPHAVTAVRGTHFCLRKVDADYIWDLFLTRRITHMNAAPTVNSMILNSPKAQKIPYQVRVTVAASPPSAKLFEDMIDHNLFPVHMYGLTETYGPFTRAYFKEEWADLPKKDHFSLLARQGHSFITSSEVRVFNDKAEEVAKNGKEIGEIVIRGNLVTKGYHENHEETAKAYGRGWFRSGDLAVWHPDGSIQILDRKKDIIISGGENISSVVVESIIVRYPNIFEASVVGVPDDHYGEVPFAFVTLKDVKQPLDKEAIRAWMKGEIGGFQVPKGFEVVDDLPKTSTGKVRKNVLRDLAKGLYQKR
ncbi:Pcs60p [Sugiyamaella lignohabitans]|uniref:Pcs60p n=1 Tax=Sugiyamaella lignohabitans TaxID=796027 RepID=A0A167DJ84_9ASCO|nr:Pcs60p [Sugiyamaella lignohabitans]ANB12978.1 Pcs60p [Sugiyamaella lignohabitans]